MVSRLFNGSNQYTQTSAFLSTPVRGCSIGGWFRTSTVSAGAYQRVAIWSTFGDGIVLGSLLLNYPSAGDLANQNYSGSGNFLPSVSGVSANSWHYGLAVCGAGATTIYLDGKQGSSASTNIALICPYFTVGRRTASADAFPGAALELTVWDDALDINDARALFRGEIPENIRGDRIVASYYPAWESRFRATDFSALGGNYPLTPTASPTSPGWADVPAQIQRRARSRQVGSTVTSFTAAITGTMGAMTATLSASHTKPTYTASIAGAIAPMTAAVSASHTPPTSTAAITASMGAMTAALSATFANPTYTASINGTFAPMTATVAASFTKPTYTASIAGTMAPMVAAVSATSAGPTYTAAIGATMAPMTASVAATFSKPVYTAAITGTVAPMSAAVSAAFINPTYSAAINATMGAMTASLSAAFSEVFFVSPVSHLSESIARRLCTEASTGIVESGSNARRLRTEAVATYVATEAVARRLRTSNVN